MKYITPACFTDFHCIAGLCSDSCCVGWEIDIDEDTFQLYNGLTGALGERLRQNIVTEADGTHHFRLGDGERCPFLNGDNLCDIILSVGAGGLCEICDQHPRFHHFFEGIEETGIGLCCEEGGRLLFATDAPFTLTEEDDGDEAETDAGETLLLDIRAGLLALVNDRSLPLQDRFALMLEWGEGLQDWLDGITEEVPQLPETVGAYSPVYPRDLLPVLQEMESIGADWDALLAEMETLPDPTSPLFAQFRHDMVPLEYTYEQFAAYLLFRYVTDALEDGELFGRIRLAVKATAVLEWMDFARWKENGGRFGMADRIWTAKLFSKQVEYSEENLDLMRNS